MRVRVVQVSLLTVVAAICLLWTCFTCGCAGEGWTHSWAVANPTKVMDVNPASGKVHFYANDGTGFKAKKLKGDLSKKTFEADELEVSERSVENRDANVKQLEQQTQLTTAAFAGFSQAVASLGQAYAAGAAITRMPREDIAVRDDPPLWRNQWLVPAALIAFGLWLYSKRDEGASRARRR